MNKLNFLVLFLSFLFLSSCKTGTSNIKEINLIVNDFNMSQLSKFGKKLYVITSPKSKFNKHKQEYLLDKTKIIFYEGEEIKYKIISNNAQLLNHEIIKLNGNIEIVDLSESNNSITTESFSWDIKNSLFILEGNVRLNNKNVELLSSKATLNKDSNVVKFFKPVKYNYKSNKNNSVYNVSSENAYYDLRDESLIFRSDSNNERVKSRISF